MSNNKIAPILLSGMHRSGTSMVTDILNKCGLIIGNKLDSNNESLFFQRINIWMMSLLGSSWDNPKIFDEINEDIKQDIVLQLEKLVRSRANTLYFGWSSIIKKGSFNGISEPWGWKDPRNTFTENIWREIYYLRKDFTNPFFMTFFIFLRCLEYQVIDHFDATP